MFPRSLEGNQSCCLFPTVTLSTPGYPPPEDNSSLVHARDYLPPPEIGPKVSRTLKSPFFCQTRISQGNLG